MAQCVEFYYYWKKVGRIQRVVEMPTCMIDATCGCVEEQKTRDHAANRKVRHDMFCMDCTCLIPSAGRSKSAKTAKWSLNSWTRLALVRMITCNLIVLRVQDRAAVMQARRFAELQKSYDAELQLAMQLSLQEANRANTTRKQPKVTPVTSRNQSPKPPPPQSRTTATVATTPTPTTKPALQTKPKTTDTVKKTLLAISNAKKRTPPTTTDAVRKILPMTTDTAKKTPPTTTDAVKKKTPPMTTDAVKKSPPKTTDAVRKTPPKRKEPEAATLVLKPKLKPDDLSNEDLAELTRPDVFIVERILAHRKNHTKGRVCLLVVLYA